MPSLNRRQVARRLAWGTGPHLLAFTPAVSVALPTCAPQAEAEVAPEFASEPVPKLVLRYAADFEGEGSTDVAVLSAVPSMEPEPSVVSLAVIHADGSRDRLESAEADPLVPSVGRSWVRLRSQVSHLRVYAGEAPALALRQA